ncbi:hypothetical protein B0T14DRAFT_150042 [Immersiella caudata]|uniref:C2H2-type domain-containing protein n=1 Tax=Immersiella caudata TaxID=314043 RepID=A0AA39WVT9_9PEZI|nr:hypothetical protein B0T14DRAFT_150042 [Immersiella caudata]
MPRGMCTFGSMCTIGLACPQVHLKSWTPAAQLTQTLRHPFPTQNLLSSSRNTTSSTSLPRHRQWTTAAMDSQIKRGRTTSSKDLTAAVAQNFPKKARVCSPAGSTSSDTYSDPPTLQSDLSEASRGHSSPRLSPRTPLIGTAEVFQDDWRIGTVGAWQQVPPNLELVKASDFSVRPEVSVTSKKCFKSTARLDVGIDCKGQVLLSSQAQDDGSGWAQSVSSTTNSSSASMPHNLRRTAGRMDDPSAQSRSGSETTQPQGGPSEELEEGEPDDDKELIDFLKRHMAPDAAHRFYRATKGKIVFDPRRPLESTGAAHSLSILEALCVDVKGFRVPVKSATSDSSGESSSRSGLNSGSGSSAPGARASGSGVPNQGDDSPTGGQVPEDGSNGAIGFIDTGFPVEPPAMRLLRCPHHAAFPELYRANDRTRQKYRTCEGPGYTKMQYLKEHIKNVHVTNVLRCHICQRTFHIEAELEHHTHHDDCPVRCPEQACGMQFPSKSQRTTHMAEQHPASNRDLAIDDLDEKKHASLKKCLQQYTSALKKGKAVGDRARDDWVAANTNGFMVGRLGAKINPLLELGQWYVVFTTLFPRVAVPDSPFYPPQDVALRNEFVIETVIYYYDCVLNATYGENGPLPIGPQEFRDISRNALHTALNVAAHTRLLPTAIGHLATSHNSEQALIPSQYVIFPVLDPLMGVVSGVQPQDSSIVGPVAGHVMPQYPLSTGDRPVNGFENGFPTNDYSNVLGQSQQPPQGDPGRWTAQ